MIEIGQRIRLKIKKDALEAHIDILEESVAIIEDKLSVEEEISHIKEHIKMGLNENLLRYKLTKGIPEKDILIAEGKKGVEGEDGKILYRFELERPLTPKLNKDGSVDYRELDAFNNVKQNQILADIIAPTEGENGFTVTGKTLFAKSGRTPKVKFGKHVHVDETGTKLLAGTNGLVEFRNKKITVSELLSLGFVDSSTGNINFDGDVILSKDLLNGFSIKATGNVEIKGALEGGYVETKGDILVRQGIQGYNKKVINNGGNLSTKFIENSIINVDGNISSEAIMHSNVISNNNIVLVGKKGLIVGGSCRARNEIAAKIVGSSMATVTILEVGVDPNVKIDYENMKGTLKESKANLKKVEQSLQILDALKKKDGLTESKQELLEKLVKTKIILMGEISGLETKIEEIQLDLKNLNKGKIKVADTVYPGVKVIIGDSYLIVSDELKRCTFYKEGGDIRIGPY